jgi:hypothetical protein
MADPLDADALMAHVRALADEIGPRPTGHPAEAAARDYIRRTLADTGITAVEEQPFNTWDTWGYGLVVPALLGLAGALLGLRGRRHAAAGALLGAASTYHLWRTLQTQRQPLAPLFPKRPSANLIARLAPRGEARHRVVLIGHTDTNKNRLTFGDDMKRKLVTTSTLNLAAQALNTLALLWRAAKPDAGLGGPLAGALTMAGLTATLLADERGPYNPGANDNASAVACLLGLGAALRQQPPQHTEVWLAFTGSEEPNALGAHVLLDQYGEELGDAWFIDFEIVGADEVAYVTRHSSMSYLSAYRPDAESLDLARLASQRAPELNIHGRAVVINDEVATLRRRGFRGICLVGLDTEGWLPNWHQADRSDQIVPGGLERAARFALAMIRELDSRRAR